MSSAPRLSRTLTRTPLARAFERDARKSRGGRRKVVAPERFDRSAYPTDALQIAAAAQRSLAAGEFMAVDVFAKLAASLTLAGAPIDVVAAAARVQVDEIRHTDLALRMASAMAGEPVSFPVPKGRYEELGGAIDLRKLDAAMTEIPAIGETLACALLAASRDLAKDPTVRALFAALLEDEVHHARLGWYWLSWRAPEWTVSDRQSVADHAGAFIAEIEPMFQRGRDAPKGLEKAARALGVLDTKAQRAAVLRAMEEEIVPGLDGLGLGASHAWKARRRTWD
ncbi:MAG: ferritin-like domain-containing protein [Polyangiaceae bacterium]